MRGNESTRTYQIAGALTLTAITALIVIIGLLRFDATSPTSSAVSEESGSESGSTGDVTLPPLEQVDLQWPDSLVAFFPMNKLDGNGFVSTAGSAPFRAQLIEGAAKLDNKNQGPFGPSIYFNGSTTYTIGGANPSANAIGALDVAKSTGEYTIIAWVKDEGGPSDMEFRAGSHVEGGPLTARQYGLYFNAYGYGGSRRVSPHMATQDGATPGYPWNVDLGASARQVDTGEWHMEVASYDGEKLVAYLDGVPDSYPSYDEPAPEQGYTKRRMNLSKNPYFNDGGINDSSTKKVFSFGASLIGETPYEPVNHTKGWMGGVAVFNKALSAEEVKRIRLATTQPSTPVLDFDFFSTGRGELPPQFLGWKSYETYRAKDMSTVAGDTTAYEFLTPDADTGHISRQAGSSEPALIYFPLTPFNGYEIRKATFDLNSSSPDASPQHLVARFGDTWYGTSKQYWTKKAHQSSADWSTAEPQEVDLLRNSTDWRVLDFDPDGHRLSLLTDRETPSGPLTAIGFYSADGVGTARIGNLKLWR